MPVAKPDVGPQVSRNKKKKKRQKPRVMYASSCVSQLFLAQDDESDLQASVVPVTRCLAVR